MMWVATHIYSAKILAYMPIFNDQSFNDTLTNDIVSFEQLGPGLRSEVQVTLKCFALDPCFCWRSFLGIGIQGKTIAITLFF